MTSRIYTVTIDCADPSRLAEFWSAVLDWKIDPDDDEDEVAIEPEDDADTALLFLRVADGKSGKNRIHFDLAPDDQDAEGNEFCVLTPR